MEKQTLLQVLIRLYCPLFLFTIRVLLCSSPAASAGVAQVYRYSLLLGAILGCSVLLTTALSIFNS